MHIGQKVRIKRLDFNDCVPELNRVLKVGCVGKIVGVFEHQWRVDDKQWIVRMADAKDYPFYLNEIEPV